MATIGIYDMDFFTYEHVMPNLECAKLLAYYTKTNNIAALTPKPDLSLYNKLLIRKDYEDGNYPFFLSEPSVSFGGRAFYPKSYLPFSEAIESIIPDMHIYQKYASYYGTARQQKELNRLMNCVHVRLAPFDNNPYNLNAIKNSLTSLKTGIIFHDYDLASVKDSREIIQILSRSKLKIDGTYGVPYNIGTKFPIQVTTIDELHEWMKIPIMPQAYSMQFNGIMPRERLQEILQYYRLSGQFYYNVTFNCANESEFLVRDLPEIFEQILFLRRAGFKILLKYDNTIFEHEECRNCLILFNFFECFPFYTNFLPGKQTLYEYCRYSEKGKLGAPYERINPLTVEQKRNIFQFIRINNYPLFSNFYTRE